MELTFKIHRFDPAKDTKPHWDRFVVTAQPEERLLDCLNRIRWRQDGTLSFRMSCAHGICGSDAMRINGTCGLACQKLVRDYDGGEIFVEPLPGFTVLKDLIVDLRPFFEKVEAVRPYLAAPGDAGDGDRERRQGPDDQKTIDEVIRCILCACCTASCPVSLERPAFLGPAALVWAFRYIFDSRDGDQERRLLEMNTVDAAWGCENHFNCTRVCPKEIPVTKCINTIKRQIEKRLDTDAGA